jgi:Flp pilus assembly protein TadD
MSWIGRIVPVGAMALILGGCDTVDAVFPWSEAPVRTAVAPASGWPEAAVSAWTETPPPTPTVRDPNVAKYYRSDEPLRLGLEHFNRGNYAIAERYFRDAVEKTPRDATAWIGLAGAYDRIGRFDFADRAYASAVKLVGETTAILNNQGYSYMLRGDFVHAREKFLKALAREPGNPTVVNNLALLNSSTQFVQRNPILDPQP